MKKEDFRLMLSETYDRLVDLTLSKGEEYARSDDQLANFKRSAAEAGITPEQVWLVFFNKHVDAIKHNLAKPRIKWSDGSGGSEPLEGRIDDAILYLILLKGLIRE